MPHSEQATNRYIIDHLRTAHKSWWGDLHFLDCGVGAGWTGKCIREATDGRERVFVHGLEIYLPYLIDWSKRSHLKACAHKCYDSITAGYQGDLWTWLKYRTRKSEYAAITFGDVLEHLSEEKAKDAIEMAMEKAQHVFYVKAPIVHYPQGPKMGNQAEIHRFHWSIKDWESTGLSLIGRSETVGCFVWERR